MRILLTCHEIFPQQGSERPSHVSLWCASIVKENQQPASAQLPDHGLKETNGACSWTPTNRFVLFQGRTTSCWDARLHFWHPYHNNPKKTGISLPHPPSPQMSRIQMRMLNAGCIRRQTNSSPGICLFFISAKGAWPYHVSSDVSL